MCRSVPTPLSSTVALAAALRLQQGPEMGKGSGGAKNGSQGSGLLSEAAAASVCTAVLVILLRIHLLLLPLSLCQRNFPVRLNRLRLEFGCKIATPAIVFLCMWLLWANQISLGRNCTSVMLLWRVPVWDH